MNTKENTFKSLIGKNGRALGSLGYFLILMGVFFIGAPEVMMRPVSYTHLTLPTTPYV